MTAYVFLALASAQACVPVVDTAQGYPLAGVDIGGGIHAPPAQSVTVTYFVPLKHPTLSQWAYIADGVSTPELSPKAVTLGLPAPVVLDSTWFPAPVVV